MFDQKGNYRCDVNGLAGQSDKWKTPFGSALNNTVKACIF